MNKWLAYYSELSNRRECANKRGVGTFFFIYVGEKTLVRKILKKNEVVLHAY